MKNQAFTLIELLVVVLIIGILAAIAIPQYQLAVDKTRLVSFIPLIKAVAQAKSEYYLATGTLPEKFSDLSITLPSDFVISDHASYGQEAYNAAKKQTIYLKNAYGVQAIGVMVLSDDSSVWYYIEPSENKTSIQSICDASIANTKADKLCASLPGATPRGGAAGHYYVN